MGVNHVSIQKVCSSVRISRQLGHGKRFCKLIIQFYKVWNVLDVEEIKTASKFDSRPDDCRFPYGSRAFLRSPFQRAIRGVLPKVHTFSEPVVGFGRGQKLAFR